MIINIKADNLYTISETGWSGSLKKVKEKNKQTYKDK